jgi:hypothetical protein
MTWPSYSMPNALVPKTKPFCPSLNVSSRIWMESVSFRSASRRLWLTTIFSGSESKLTTPIYRVRRSSRKRTSVR